MSRVKFLRNTETRDTETRDTETRDTETLDTETPDTGTPDTETLVFAKNVNSALTTHSSTLPFHESVLQSDSLIAKNEPIFAFEQQAETCLSKTIGF